jgi:hypothetical protein
MSINTAVQQFSMGIASLVSGKIIGEGPKGEMTHYTINGIISITCCYGCIYLAKFLKTPAQGEAVAEPIYME